MRMILGCALVCVAIALAALVLRPQAIRFPSVQETTRTIDDWVALADDRTATIRTRGRADRSAYRLVHVKDAGAEVETIFAARRDLCPREGVAIRPIGSRPTRQAHAWAMVPRPGSRAISDCGIDPPRCLSGWSVRGRPGETPPA